VQLSWWSPCCAVSGDQLTQMLHVLLDYYMTGWSMYRHRASDIIAQKTKTMTLQAQWEVTWTSYVWRLNHLVL
jgi:hypothetical protein